MTKRDIFVVFEPINHMYWVAQSALEMEYELVFVSTLPVNTVPPFSIDPADVYRVINIASWQNDKEIYEIINGLCEKYNVVGTYAAFESTLVFDAHMRNKANLPSNKPEVLKKALNKKYVRETLKQHGLTDLAFYSKSECESWTEWPLEGAGYFKPVNGAGSAMVTHCENIDDLKQAITAIENKASQVYVSILEGYIADQDEFFLEQAAAGELLSLESILVDGKLIPLGLTSRTRLTANPSVEMGAIYPYQNKHFDKIVEKATAIHNVLNIEHGPTHTEFMVSEDGIVELVEINLRLIGADMIEAINQAHMIKFQNLIAEIASGKKISPADLDFKTHRYSSLQFIIPPSNETHYDSLVFPNNVTYARRSKKAGDKLSGNAYQLDQIASFIVAAPTHYEVEDLAKKVRIDTIFNGKKLGSNINNVVEKF